MSWLPGSLVSPGPGELKHDKVKRIHFVDDSDDEMFITKLAFERQKIDVEIQHFYDLTSFFRFLDGCTLIDLNTSITVLDMNLTVAKGTDGIRQLRSQPHFFNHLVGICSGSDDPADKQAAQDAGANFFISKPLNSTALLSICDVVPTLKSSVVDGRMQLHRVPEATVEGGEVHLG